MNINEDNIITIISDWPVSECKYIVNYENMYLSIILIKHILKIRIFSVNQMLKNHSHA